jgi:4-diphosphocytidyl-2-C-methyl-D-erythritol kinase
LAVPLDGSNLILRARDALRAHAGTGCPPVAISLEKNLPVASGIGGGSSDAAATLKGLARLWGVEDDALLAKLALPLGADVPMCLSPQPALVSGVGEKIERLPDFSPLFIVLVNPGVEVSTPAVFSRLKAKNIAGLKRTFPVCCEASVVRPPLRPLRGHHSPARRGRGSAGRKA